MIFFDVIDVRAFAIKLDNIFIGNQKLHINVPRFLRKYEVDENKSQREVGQCKDKVVEAKIIGVRVSKDHRRDEHIKEGGFSRTFEESRSYEIIVKANNISL